MNLCVAADDAARNGQSRWAIFDKPATVSDKQRYKLIELLGACHGTA